MTNTNLQRFWPVLALIASAAMLAGAHAFETFGGFAPCQLCLRQREIYWAAIGLSILAVGVIFIWKKVGTSRVFDVALGLVFLTGAVVAAYHAGVEWKFWPGPASCAANAIPKLSAEDIMNALNHKAHPPSCEDAAWRMGGISMAGYNAVISLVLTGVSFCAAAITPRALGDDHG